MTYRPSATIDGYRLQLGARTPEDPLLGWFTVPLGVRWVVVRQLPGAWRTDRLAVVRTCDTEQEAEAEARLLRPLGEPHGHSFLVVEVPNP